MNEVAAAERRRRAAAKYRPAQIDLLLVGEAPPTALDRYFYFADVREHDGLFRYVAKMILGAVPPRDQKREALEQLKDRRVFFIDLVEDPFDVAPLETHVPGLIPRVKRLRPERIILIKVDVFDAAFAALRTAGLPVVDQRIPFPSSGQQRRFEHAFGRALAAV